MFFFVSKISRGVDLRREGLAASSDLWSLWPGTEDMAHGDAWRCMACCKVCCKVYWDVLRCTDWDLPRVPSVTMGSCWCHVMSTVSSIFKYHALKRSRFARGRLVFLIRRKVLAWAMLRWNSEASSSILSLRWHTGADVAVCTIEKASTLLNRLLEDNLFCFYQFVFISKRHVDVWKGWCSCSRCWRCPALRCVVGIAPYYRL